MLVLAIVKASSIYFDLFQTLADFFTLFRLTLLKVVLFIFNQKGLIFVVEPVGWFSRLSASLMLYDFGGSIENFEKIFVILQNILYFQCFKFFGFFFSFLPLKGFLHAVILVFELISLRSQFVYFVCIDGENFEHLLLHTTGAIQIKKKILDVLVHIAHQFYYLFAGSRLTHE